MKIIHLLDYGVGNIGSLTGLLERLDYVGVLTADVSVIAKCPVLLLPGVGSAVTALHELESRGLVHSLRERHSAGLPTVGICLGAQLFFSHLDEAGRNGLGFLDGGVSALEAGKGFNVGWGRMHWEALRGTGLATRLSPEDSFFFNHQYKFPLNGEPGVVSMEEFADIPAMFLNRNLCGLQFHPEKSQLPGTQLMKNILHYYYG